MNTAARHGSAIMTLPSDLDATSTCDPEAIGATSLATPRARNSDGTAPTGRSWLPTGSFRSRCSKGSLTGKP